MTSRLLSLPLLILIASSIGCVGYIDIKPEATLLNNRPYIKVLDPLTDRITLRKGERITFKVQVGDPDLGDELHVFWLLDADKFPGTSLRCDHGSIEPLTGAQSSSEPTGNPTTPTSDLRPKVIPCEIEYTGTGIQPGSFHILRFVVGDRRKASVSQPAADGTIKWSVEETKVDTRLFVIEVEK